MIKILTTLITISLFILSSGCSRIDIDAMSSEKAYVYSKDINQSQKYNSGTSTYFYQLPFESDYRVLYVDYGINTVKFKASYTLPTEQKISIDVDADIIFRLNEAKEDLPYSKDKIIQYFTTSVSPIRDSRDSSIKVEPSLVWDKLMAEPTDLTFRSVFTNIEKYPSFDDVETSIPKIQKDIKETLAIKAEEHHIEIIGIKIKDIPVPEPIADSRSRNLELSQEAINQVQELEIKARNAAMQMAVDVRYAMNDVIIDNLVSDNTNKVYMLMETMRKGVEKGNSMEINLTPDFLRYLEKEGKGSGAQKKSSDKELFERLNAMNDKELMEYFTKK